jgi:hypothetical protein
MKTHIEIRHSFKLVFDVQECTMSEKLLLCNAFDGYEVLKEVAEIFVVDVLSFDQGTLTLRISLKEPLTYKEIDEYIGDMMEFVKEQTNYKIDFSPVAIHWDIKKYGHVSDLFDSNLLISHPTRRALLEKLDIKTTREKRVRSKARFDLKEGRMYLVKERKSDKAFDVFTDLVTHGVQGLCISRSKPEQIREEQGIKKTPIVWLTNNETPDEKCLPPTDIPRLHLAVSDFLEKAQDSIVLLDGMEYLMTNNNFTTCLKLIQLLSDKVMLHNGRMIVPIGPDAVTEKEMGLIEKEMEVLFEEETGEE